GLLLHRRSTGESTHPEPASWSHPAALRSSEKGQELACLALAKCAAWSVPARFRQPVRQTRSVSFGDDRGCLDRSHLSQHHRRRRRTARPRDTLASGRGDLSRPALPFHDLPVWSRALALL